LAATEHAYSSSAIHGDYGQPTAGPAGEKKSMLL